MVSEPMPGQSEIIQKEVKMVGHKNEGLDYNRYYAADLAVAAKKGFWGSACRGKIPKKRPLRTRIPI